jgi:hypothetical protein
MKEKPDKNKDETPQMGTLIPAPPDRPSVMEQKMLRTYRILTIATGSASLIVLVLGLLLMTSKEDTALRYICASTMIVIGWSFASFVMATAFLNIKLVQRLHRYYNPFGVEPSQALKTIKSRDIMSTIEADIGIGPTDVHPKDYKLPDGSMDYEAMYQDSKKAHDEQIVKLLETCFTNFCGVKQGYNKNQAKQCMECILKQDCIFVSLFMKHSEDDDWKRGSGEEEE